MSQEADIVHDAVRLALQNMHNAYAPYSNFQVGSALKAQGIATLYGGCNVENASFGATICAERNALGQIIAAHGKIALEFVVVMSNRAYVVPPCGICLQMLAEFAEDSTVIYLATPDGIKKTVAFRELLPSAFRGFD